MKFSVDRAIVGEFRTFASKRCNYSRMSPSVEWSSDIEWISAADEESFAVFQSAFDRLDIAAKAEPYLDIKEQVRLYAGFLVVRSRCSEPHFHVDWSDTNNEAFTFLTPVSGDCSDFGLLYERLDNTIGQYDYRPGEGIAFGDKFLHSTQPGAADRPVVLLCFVYGTDKMTHWARIRRTVETQVTHLRQPDGAFVPSSNVLRTSG